MAKFVGEDKFRAPNNIAISDFHKLKSTFAIDFRNCHGLMTMAHGRSLHTTGEMRIFAEFR